MRLIRLLFAATVALIFSSLTAAKGAEQVTVEVNGFGDSPASAEKAAIRAAVRKVVGTLVDAETLVENEDLISEKILTASNGFVSRYEIVEGPYRRRDGTIRVKIRAVVEKGQLVPKIRAATSVATSGQVDGKGLFAELVTRQDTITDARAMLSGLFENVPQKLLTAELVVRADGKPDMNLNARTGCITVKIRVRVNHAAYGKWTSDLQRFCDKMCKSKSQNGDLGIIVPRSVSAYSFNNFVPALDHSPPPMEHAISETWVDHSALKARNLEYHGYCFSEDLLPVVLEYFRINSFSKVRFSVAVLSADGTVLSEQEGVATFEGCERTRFILMTPHSWGDPILHLVVPGWFFYDPGFREKYIGSSCTMSVNLGPFLQENLRSASKFKCSILPNDELCRSGGYDPNADTPRFR